MSEARTSVRDPRRSLPGPIRRALRRLGLRLRVAWLITGLATTAIVTCGLAASPRHRITVLEPPAVASIAATVEPSAYTGRPSFPAPRPTGCRIGIERAAPEGNPRPGE